MAGFRGLAVNESDPCPRLQDPDYEPSRRRALSGPLLGCALTWITPAFAQFEKQVLTPSILADTTAVAAGKPFTVGVVMKMDPGWHIYWQYSGPAGNPPEIEWVLPQGFRAGPIQWPIPEAHTDSLGVSYIYDKEVMFPVEITPPAALPPGDVVLKAKLTWFVCSTSCTRGTGEVQIKIPTAGTPAPANEPLFAKWRATLPKDVDSLKYSVDAANPAEFRATVEGLPADQKIEFFPIPPEGATPGDSQGLRPRFPRQTDDRGPDQGSCAFKDRAVARFGGGPERRC